MDEQRVKYEAFYISSDLKYRVGFEFIVDTPNFYDREGFEKLAEEFASHVESFGRVNPFPAEIMNALDDEGLDRLLQDTELIPHLTYFIQIDSKEIFYSRENCEPYRLRGANGVMSMIETLDGKVIDILEAKNLKRVFEKVG